MNKLPKLTPIEKFLTRKNLSRSVERRKTHYLELGTIPDCGYYKNKPLPCKEEWYDIVKVTKDPEEVTCKRCRKLWSLDENKGTTTESGPGGV